MNRFLFWLRPPVAGVMLVALAAVGRTKPPATPKAEKAPSTAPGATAPADEAGAASFLRWLLLQNGGPDAVSVSWSELVRATTGKMVAPLDPANPADAAEVLKFGSVLDLILPRLNRPDGELRAAAPLNETGTAARVAEALRAALGTAPSLTVANLADPGPPDAIYPNLRCIDSASGKTYYFSVALYPTGGRDDTLRALTLHPAESSRRITTDGCCLLVALEHNGKSGKELAFLNWELIDLARVSVRCAVGFEADEHAVHQPGAIVTDGRKGRD